MRRCISFEIANNNVIWGKNEKDFSRESSNNEKVYFLNDIYYRDSTNIIVYRFSQKHQILINIEKLNFQNYNN